MTDGVNGIEASRIVLAAGLGGAALLLASSPAAAEQARASMSVTAIVAPACSVATRRSPRARPAIACSTGAAVSTKTAARHDERPLAQAEAQLGVPVRRNGAVVFTASPAAAEARADAAALGTRYLTITY